VDNFLEFLKTFKNQKYVPLTLIIFIIGSVITFFINLEKAISLHKIKVTSLYKIMDIIASNWLNLLYLLILVIVFINILRYSHKKSQPREEDFYNENAHYKVEVVNFVGGNIKISRSSTGYKLQIYIQNISNEDILNVDGFLSISDNKVRIKKIPFEVSILKPGYSESIYQSVNEFELFNFDICDIYINEIKTKSITKKEIYNVGPKRVNRFYKILNMERFIDYKLFGLRTRYNLVWFKKKSREVFRYIRWLYKRKVYVYGKGIRKHNLFHEVCSFIKRSIIFICIYTIILIIFCVTLFAVIKTLFMFWELLPFLWKFIKEVTAIISKI
jgi:hypothetical protein